MDSPARAHVSLILCGPLEKTKKMAARHAVRQPFGVNSIMAELCVKGCNVRDKASAAAAAAEQINSCVGGKKEEGGGRWRARQAVQFRGGGRRNSQPGYDEQTSFQPWLQWQDASACSVFDKLLKTSVFFFCVSVCVFFIPVCTDTGLICRKLFLVKNVSWAKRFLRWYQTLDGLSFILSWWFWGIWPLKFVKTWAHIAYLELIGLFCKVSAINPSVHPPTHPPINMIQKQPVALTPTPMDNLDLPIAKYARSRVPRQNPHVCWQSSLPHTSTMQCSAMQCKEFCKVSYFFSLLTIILTPNHDDIFQHHWLPPWSWAAVSPPPPSLPWVIAQGSPSLQLVRPVIQTNTNTGSALVAWCHLHSGYLHAQGRIDLEVSLLSKYLQVSHPWRKLLFRCPGELSSPCCSFSLSPSEQHIHCGELTGTAGGLLLPFSRGQRGYR